MMEVRGGEGCESPKEVPDQPVGSVSQGGLPGRGNRNDIILLCLCMAELPQGITPTCPIRTPPAQRLIYEYTLRLPCFHTRLPTTAPEFIAMD